jgi:hypothetical protein
MSIADVGPVFQCARIFYSNEPPTCRKGQNRDSALLLKPRMSSFASIVEIASHTSVTVE